MVSNLPFLKNKLITMAKPTGGSVISHTAKQHKKRPGVHSKNTKNFTKDKVNN